MLKSACLYDIGVTRNTTLMAAYPATWNRYENDARSTTVHTTRYSIIFVDVSNSSYLSALNSYPQTGLYTDKLLYHQALN